MILKIRGFRVNVLDLMKKVFHQMVEEFKKKRLHDKLTRRITSSYRKNKRELSEEYLEQIEKEIDNLDV